MYAEFYLWLDESAFTDLLVGLVVVTVLVLPLGLVLVTVFSFITGADVFDFDSCVVVCANAPKVIRAAANTIEILFKLFIF